MNIAIIYSSITGNTLSIAKHISNELIKSEHKVKLVCSNNTPINYTEVLKGMDLCLIGFWTRKGYLDDFSVNTLSNIKNMNVAFFGTACAYPDSIHILKCKLKIAQETEKTTNKYLGIFMCQGRVPIKRTQQRLSLEPSDPHYLDEAGLKRHMEARNHPNNEDFHQVHIWASRIINHAKD